MKMLRVGAAFFVNADSIELLLPWSSRVARRKKPEAERAGIFYDATRGKRILSLVVLKSGWVVASPYHTRALVQRPVIQAPTRASTRRDAEEVDAARFEQIAVFEALGDGHSADEPPDDEPAPAFAPEAPPERRGGLSRLMGRRKRNV